VEKVAIKILRLAGPKAHNARTVYQDGEDCKIWYGVVPDHYMVAHDQRTLLFPITAVQFSELLETPPEVPPKRILPEYHISRRKKPIA